MKGRILLKAVTIAMMAGSLMTILGTVMLQTLGLYPFDLMRWHMGAGIVMLSVAPVHIYMMRQKLKKLSEQLHSLVMTGEYTSSCASQLLPNAFSTKSLAEFCTFLQLDPRGVDAALSRGDIRVGNPDESIAQIARANRIDTSKVFAILLQRENPAETADPSRYYPSAAALAVGMG